MKKCWIVKARDGIACATFRNHEYRTRFDEVPTACGMVVVLSGGTERGVPTCEACKKTISRRRKPNAE